MKQIPLISLGLSLLLTSVVQADNLPMAETTLVGDRIVQFVPKGYDPVLAPSLMLVGEPTRTGDVPADWSLVPRYALTDGKASASLDLPDGIDLYGGGEVTGTLRRNGKTIKMWNCDTGLYLKDNGTRLYQTHPWVMGVRPDGTAFGILFDSFWKAELTTDDRRIEYRTEGGAFRTYVIDRESPQAVMRGLAELTGTISMPPRWALGYHQCRFSYVPEARVQQIADTFRLKKIPCDVIWFDINYMDEFRVFTINDRDFPDPARMNRYLHDRGFRSVYMIDPGVKVDSAYAVYRSGREQDVFVRDAYRREFHGKVWPGACAFPDFTRPETRRWWAGLYKPFLACGIDGIWNDMNEPSVFDGPDGTMPESVIHLGGGTLPTGTHRMYHNAYGRLMVEASYDGILAANPDKRPFVLSRSNTLGGQRFAATWTGDNGASVDHLKLSVPMSLTLGLSGQPFNGPDIGGFAGTTTPDLWGQWLGFGAFFPFARGHASYGENNKEPWAYGKAIERESRIAIERRYRLLPYLYTLFREASTDGMPIMAPVFFADPADRSLRAEEQAFLLGADLLVVPRFAQNPALPKGTWETLSLVKGDLQSKYQAELKVRGGAILPVGRVIQNTTERSYDPHTLIDCPDANGYARGTLYWDAGDGWQFRHGDYKCYTFEARRAANGRYTVRIVDSQGNAPIDLGKVEVSVLQGGRTTRGTFVE
jgi:alpha-glucosidase